MAIRIREYVESDFKRLVEMATDLIDQMSKLDSLKRFRARGNFDGETYVRARLREVNEQHGRILIAEDAGNAVGYVMATIRESSGADALNKIPFKQGEIDALFIAESHQRQGIATKLLTAIEAFFLENGCDYSCVGCLATNDSVRKLYAKNGYIEQYVDCIKKL